MYHMCLCILVPFPGYLTPECEYVYTGRPWYLFSCEFYVIEIGQEFLEQKGCSTNYSFNTQCVRYSPSPDSYVDTCSKLPTTFTLFSVFGYTHTQLRPLYPSLPLALLTWEKIPGSPCLHNFNVHVPEQGSLGTRLCVSREWGSTVQFPKLERWTIREAQPAHFENISLSLVTSWEKVPGS